MSYTDEQLNATADRHRRRKPKTAPDNVERDLDASATPLTPDPTLKPKAEVPEPDWDTLDSATGVPAQDWRRLMAQGHTREDAMRILAERDDTHQAFLRSQPSRLQRSDARIAAFDRSLADAMGHNVAPPAVQGDTVNVDGYDLPAVLGSDGQPLGSGTDNEYYRLGDLKHAKEAEAEAAATAAVQKQIDEENARYGHYGLRDGDPNLTEAQAQARVARKEREGREKILRDKRSKTFAAYKQKEDERRDRYAAMAALAGGTQNLNSGNRAMYYALSLLEPEEQRRVLTQMMPMDPVRAEVEARQMDMAGRMAQNAVTAFLTNNPGATPEVRQAAALQAQNAQAQQAGAIADEAKAIVGEYADDKGWFNLLTRGIGGGIAGFDPTVLTVDEEEKAVRRLRAKYPHLTYEQALEHVIAAASNTTRQRSAAKPASEATGPSQSQSFPGQQPAAPPSNPLAAPRPYG